MNKAKTKFHLIVMVLLTLICLLFGSIVSAFISPNKALALTESGKGNAVVVGKGADLWNDSTNNFNGAVLSDLKEKLFNNQSPSTYIESKYDRDEYKLTGSKIVAANTLNAQVGKAEEGMIVKLGKQDWMVTSLTTTNDGKEDIVLTLYLANPDTTEKVQYWKEYTENTTFPYGKKGENMYSRSILREHLLTYEKWSMFSSGDFASNYLVQPTKIQYQHTQSALGRWQPTFEYHYLNETLDTLAKGDGITSGQWHDQLYYGGQTPYNAEDVFNDNSGNPQRYDAWGEDYIWIPSLSEVGCQNGYANEKSVWKLSLAQMKFWNGTTSNTNQSCWRSGYANTFSGVHSFNADGKRYPAKTTDTFSVRPAIHLNLTEAIESVTNILENPQDLNTVFNENEHTIKSLATECKASWYNNDIYEHIGNYINITYPNNQTFLKNAGEYWVKIEITQNYVDYINAEIEKEGEEYGWTDDEIAKVQEMRKPMFRGAADTTDPNHLESDTVRWITVNIDKAEIDFSNVVWSNGTFEYDAVSHSVEIVSGLPSFLTPKYDINSKIEVGIYTTKVVGFDSTNANYRTPTLAEIEKIPQLSHEWQITKKQIAVSWSSEEVTINGVTLDIPKLNIAEQFKNIIEYEFYRDADKNDKVTLEEIFAEMKPAEIQNYWVTASLPSAGGNFNRTNSDLVFGGTQVEYAEKGFSTGSNKTPVSVSLRNDKFTFNGKPQPVSFNISGGGLTAEALIVTYMTANGDIIDSIPTNAGKYKVSVALKDGLDKYVIVSESEFDFEIKALKISKPQANQIQAFDGNGYDLSAVATLPADWQNYLEIKVLDADGNEIEAENGNWHFVKASKYRIEIAFKNGMNIATGGEADNVLWEDDDDNAYAVNLEIMRLRLAMGEWANSTANKRPTLIAEEKAEIEKYFDYIIFEMKGNIIIGNKLPQNATLKFNTNYQIYLEVKPQFKDSVVLDCDGNVVDKTEPYLFKTEIDPNAPNGGDEGEEDGDGGIGGGIWQGKDGKTPVIVWIFVGVICFLILVILLMIIMIAKQSKNIKKLQPFHEAPQPIIINNVSDNADDQNLTKSVKQDARASIVNPNTASHKDWTFIVKESDIFNIEMMNDISDDRTMFYAFKENDLRKLKKFQTQISQEDNQTNAQDLDENDKNIKKKNKKR